MDNTGESTTTPSGPAANRAVSGWKVVGGLGAGLALVVGGLCGWSAWKQHLFEKERTETPPHVVEGLKLKLLWIPAGTFVMGTEEEAEWLKSLKKKYNDVKPSEWSEWKLKVEPEDDPAHEVSLTKGFYLGQMEVTQAQWKAVMGSNPSENKGAKLPVELVSWEDCVEFCRKLTLREKAAGRIGATQVFRLPTEAEWEYACRAGCGGDFCFGDDESRLEEFAWFRDNSDVKQHEVGTKRANAWGLYDMHGNVWEWCADWRGAYPGGFVSNPTGVVTGGSRVIRGGFYYGLLMEARSARRFSLGPDRRDEFLGFRLALSSVP